MTTKRRKPWSTRGSRKCLRSGPMPSLNLPSARVPRKSRRDTRTVSPLHDAVRSNCGIEKLRVRFSQLSSGADLLSGPVGSLNDRQTRSFNIPCRNAFCSNHACIFSCEPSRSHLAYSVSAGISSSKISGVRILRTTILGTERSVEADSDRQPA